MNWRCSEYIKWVKKIHNYVQCVPNCLNTLFIEYTLYARFNALHVFISVDSHNARREVLLPSHLTHEETEV